MVKAIRIHRTGGPEVMTWEDVPVGAPGKGEIRVRHAAVGLNFIDTYHRGGLYPVPLPAVIGMEGAGIVEAIGSGVKEFRVGDRIAYAQPMGSYSEARVMPADRAVLVPKGVSEETAAAAMLKGLTAQYLIRQTYKVKKGETVLFHAAAGGVGLIACQWLNAIGARVIGTVSTLDKAKIAKRHGCHFPIVMSEKNFVDEVKRLTKGEGVPVVYDGNGKSTWEGSLECLRPRGMMVSFGNASGPVPPFSLGVLQQKGSLYVTRPSLMAYASKRADLLAMAKDLFKAIKSGDVKIEINQRYPLREATRAHADLESRRTTGSTVLIP
jgi:NADPH:quinone reductase